MRSAARHTTSVVTMAAYAALVFGLPLPAIARKADDQPYPCQDSACGCLSAAQCWTSCCCTTPEERFAWARERGITPPAFAEPPKSNGWQTTPQRERDKAPAKKSCCSQHAESKPTTSEPSRVSGRVVPPNGSNPSSVAVKKSCCQSTSECPTEPEQSPTEDATPPTKAGFVLGMSALKCQGLMSSWASAGLAPVPPAWSNFQSYIEAQEWVALPSFEITSRSSLPLLPPPRV